MPDLTDRLNLFPDPRKRKEYQTAELVIGGIALFLFKEGSRNAFNSDRKEESFQKNYHKIFRSRLPQMDAVEDLFRVLQCDELEKLKVHFMCQLIEKKVFQQYRFLGKWFLVAVDATGVHTFEENYSGECLSKTSKKGVTNYFENVLEAKLVTSNNMSFSLCSEWLVNPADGNYDKQDCEHNAFKRLAVKLKEFFPRLSICIVADGLYPNKTFMKICQDNHWNFIVSFQDGNLKTVQEEISLLPDSAKSKTENYILRKHEKITQNYRWVNNIAYGVFKVHWIECIEVTRNIKTKEMGTVKFVYLCSIPISTTNAIETVFSGRLRWNIENSFNTQKNHGYSLKHKFSRISFNATKNYYQCMQLAHLILQFVEKSFEIKILLKSHSKETIKHLWDILIAFMIFRNVKNEEINTLYNRRSQIRLAC